MYKSLGYLSSRTALLAAISAALLAQPVRAQAIVQSSRVNPAGMKLNDALGQLARNPQDLEALIAAGRASLELGDVQAAIGFFRRADMLWPGSARIKSGLAGAYVLGADPITAIGMFSDAEKLGPIDAERLTDRGLAYDLVGDNETAQAFYRQSLSLAPKDETLRRLALSLAISGDRRGMESTLSPLLQRQDKAAWRTRAFALAILGEAGEAESIAHQTMPDDLANSMSAYLRYMPRLTPAQQAAAASLGQFPRAAEIGHDDPRFARFARPRATFAAAKPVPVPGMIEGKGKSRSKDKDQDHKKDPQLAVALPPPPVPTPRVSREVDSRPPPPVLVAKPAPPLPAPAAVAVARPAAISGPVTAPVAAPKPAPAAIDPAPIRTAEAFSLPPRTKPVAQPPANPAPKPAAKTAPGESIDEAFADFIPPSREVEPQAGAVDLRRLSRTAKPEPVPAAAKASDTGKPGDKTKSGDKTKPGEKVKPGDKAKDKAKEKDKEKDKEKASKLAQPSRIWVQVATGRDKGALASDWRHLLKDDPAVFKGKKPFVSAWGQTNRLLTGPFGNQKEAAAFIAALKKVEVAGAFAWSSPAGQVVDPLGSGK